MSRINNLFDQHSTMLSHHRYHCYRVCRIPRLFFYHWDGKDFDILLGLPFLSLRIEKIVIIIIERDTRLIMPFEVNRIFPTFPV